MWSTMFRIYLRIVFSSLVIIINISDLILGLRDVSVTIPSAVRRGDNALLICNYDIENETLYSVKWYKGRREFYRYTPKEVPAMKTFPSHGINVEQTLSNQSHLVLSSVQLNLSGKFACEISADAPEFHTLIATGTMIVVELPEQRPIITSIHSRYRLGDTVNGNCSSDYSKPAANLTWTINDISVQLNQLRIFNVQKNPSDNLETSVIEINFIINHMHFIRGRLKLKCTAKIFNIYEQESEKIIEEDRPRILASGRSPDMNLFPFDQQGEGDFPDQNELFSTHYKETSSAGASSIFSTYQDNINKIKYYLQRTTKFGNYFIIIIINIFSIFNLPFYIIIYLFILLVNNLCNFLLYFNYYCDVNKLNRKSKPYHTGKLQQINSKSFNQSQTESITFS